MQDLIERRAALTALCEDCKTKYNGLCPHPASRCVEFRTIKQLPAIDAEPVRHGRWIFGSSKTSSWMKCSLCCKSQSGQTATFSYCPNCGAKMDGGVENG